MSTQQVYALCQPLTEFPSPCGEDVMSTLACLDGNDWRAVFPSPCGEDVMSTNP